MQTFVPDSSSFRASLETLDYRRLGKQRVECKQIVQCLEKPEGTGWRNHPAVKMWAGYEQALLRYGRDCCQVWREMGYNDAQLEWFEERMTDEPYELPDWWGNEEIHSSHRANLIRKDPDHYNQFGWTEAPLEGYVWPTHERTP